MIIYMPLDLLKICYWDDPVEKGSKNEKDRVVTPKSVSIYQNPFFSQLVWTNNWYE